MQNVLLYLVMEDGTSLLWLGIAVVAVFAYLKGSAIPVGDISISSLTNDLDAQSRLNGLYAAMLNNNWSTTQCLFGLSQCLFESGLLTGQGNYGLMNQYNYAGLTSTSGAFAAYSSYQDFVNNYEGFLTKGANPLGATNLTDFNNRLVQNGYYTENPTVYYNGLKQYYDELVSTISNG
jgi:hypothetical protein